MTAILKKCPVSSTWEINSKLSRRRGIQPPKASSLRSLRKKKKKKKKIRKRTLNLLKTRCSESLIAEWMQWKGHWKIKSQHSRGRHHMSIGRKCGRSSGEEIIHLGCPWVRLAAASRMDSLQIPELNCELGLSPGSDIPEPWPVTKRYLLPNKPPARLCSSSQDTQAAESPIEIKAAKMWYIYLVDNFSVIKICPQNEGITTLGATAMGLEGSHTKGIQSGGGGWWQCEASSRSNEIDSQVHKLITPERNSENSKWNKWFGNK